MDEFFQKKSALEKESERREIERQNEQAGIYIASTVFLVLLILNPIAVILGIWVIKKRAPRIFAVASCILMGLMISVIYSIFAKVSIQEQLINYLMNFYNLKEGKIEFVEFLFGYILSPFFIMLFGLSVAGGAIVKSLFDTRSKAEFADREASKRFNKDGEEIRFFEGLSFKTFFEELLPKKFIKDVNNIEIEGTIFGKEENKQVFITDEEAKAHGMVVGSTGAGKTNLLLFFVQSCAERSKALFFIDGKGDPTLSGKIKKIAGYYGRKFYHFDIKGEKSRLCYNPLFLGNPDNTKEKLMDTQNWSEEHYKSASSRVLLFISKVINQVIKETRAMSEDELREYYDLREGEEIPRIKKDIITIQEMLTPAFLDMVVRSVKDDDLRHKWTRINEKCNPEWYSGLEQRLALIAESALEELVLENGKGVRLTDVMEEKAIILFSLNSLENTDLTEMMGRLIVKDINTAITMKKDNDIVYSIYDEHGSYISEDVGNQFAMARSFGLNTITCTQNISDYQNSRLGDILMRKVVGNTNFKIIMKQNEAENAEYIARNIGTHKNVDQTLGTNDMGKLTSIGLKSVEEFIINPNKIKNLKKGEAFIIKKIPEQEISKKVNIGYMDMKKFDEENDNLITNKKQKVEIKTNNNNLHKNTNMSKRFKRDPLARRNRRLENERKNRDKRQ